jgi:AcrR family transcriptional regulator
VSLTLVRSFVCLGLVHPSTNTGSSFCPARSAPLPTKGQDKALPTISDHFTDRAAIIDAGVANQLATLATLLTSAAQAGSDPVDTDLHAWRAYVEFGRTYPTRYRIIFERRFLALWDEDQRPMIETLPLFTGTVVMMIGLLQTCIDTGRSRSTDALADSVAIWFFVHGMVALPTTITSFPWPDHDAHLVAGITSLAHLQP